MACHLVRVEPGFLRDIFAGNIHTPTLYYHPNPSVREVFWHRLRQIALLVNRHSAAGGVCLDFGGGSGVILPSLAPHFSEVRCLDLDPRCAVLVKERYGLGNVEIDQANAIAHDYGPDVFDAIVAADVLEHFEELAPPVSAIRRWLKPDGVLYTSLPTESTFYKMLRTVFGVTQPDDHYQDAVSVERYLAANGFCEIDNRRILPGLPFLCLFSIKAWRRTS